jgi:hypothetical protein
MWSFFEHASRNEDGAAAEARREDASPRKPLRFVQILDGMGDFRDLGKHDVALKFWLPEPVEQALDELRDKNRDSTSEFLRQFLVVHCYGLYAFRQMADAVPGLFKDSDGPLYSREPMVSYDESGKDGPAQPASIKKKRVETYWVPELGKNVAPIKIWIPSRLRNDLQTLADHVGIKLSQYLREIVVSRLLGHGMLPSRPEMLRVFPLPAAEDWWDGKEVPLMQVAKKELHQSTDVEIRYAS